MPMFVYECDAPSCAHVWEELVLGRKDMAPETCPSCGDKRIRKCPSMPTYRFRAGVGGAGGWEINSRGTMQRVVKGRNTTRYGDGSV